MHVCVCVCVCVCVHGLTGGPVQLHLQGGQAGLAAVHGEGLEDVSPDPTAQPRAGAPHLPRVHQLPDRHAERTACRGGGEMEREV